MGEVNEPVARALVAIGEELVRLGHSIGDQASVTERALDQNLDRFVGLQVAADRLGMSLETARRLARCGQFPVPVKTTPGGRIYKVSLRHIVDYVNG